MPEDGPPTSAAGEAAGPGEDNSQVEAFSKFLAEVQTKMDRHQRELLQRLNFQDEVLSLLLVAKPEQRAMAETEIYYQEQRQPPEPESLPVDPPKYGSKVASRQESLDAAVLEAPPAAVVEEMNLDLIEIPHSRQVSRDSGIRKESAMIDVQQQLDRVGASKPRLFRTQSEKEEAMRRAASAREGTLEIDLEGAPEDEANDDICPSQTRRSIRNAPPPNWGEMSWREKMQRVVQSMPFEIFFSVCIVANAVELGVDVQMLARNPGHSAIEMEVIGYIFTALFSVELFLRMAAYGKQFFLDKNLAWNIMDLIIVGSAFVEIIVQMSLSMLNQDTPPGVSTLTNMRVLRIIRITRLVRLTRIARITRFIKALRTLVSSIVFTLKSLVWALVLLSLIIYGFGIVFTQASTLYLMDYHRGDGALDDSDPILVAINEYWKDLPASMLTLFMAICGGVSWENALRPMSVVSEWCAFLFLFYISFCYFAVLNVVTGVFCQSAIESAQSDHEMIMQNIIHNKEAHIRKVRSLFSNLDADESGYISLVELEENMHNKSVQTYFEALELDVSDAWTFFKLLDTDGGAAIEIEEFLLGCLRLRGPARALDLAKMQHDHQWLSKTIGAFMAHVEVSLRKLEAGLLKLCELQFDSQLDASSQVPSVPSRDKSQGSHKPLGVPPLVIHKAHETEQLHSPAFADAAVPAAPQEADGSPAPTQSSEGVTHVNHVIVPRGPQEQSGSVLVCESRAEQL